MIALAALLLLSWLPQGDAPARAAEAGPEVAAPVAPALPGRDADERVAAIALRLATAGRARCPTLHPLSGIVWQHLSQFTLADRPALVAAQALDRGPEAVAVVPQGPGAAAGVRPGDVLLAIDGTPLPPEPALTEPFDQARAQARVDLLDARFEAAGVRPVTLTLLRRGAAVPVDLRPVAACPARVRLARSTQTNAFADDGDHVFLTTGLLALARSDDELAFVIAHEMAHTILGHPALLRAHGIGRGLLRGVGANGALLRETERAADHLGGELMLDAGYDPVAGARLLARLGGLDLGIALFATHDPAGEREAAMRALVAARAAP